MKNLYPSIADHTSGTILNEKRAFDLCRQLIEEGHEASVSTDTVLGTKQYTVCWND